MMLMKVKRVGGMNVMVHQRWEWNKSEGVQNQGPGRDVINVS